MRKEKEFPVCQAPVHSEGCDGIGSTTDHFTPECIAKLWGWEKKEMNARENLQHLSPACHFEKDRTTQARLALAIRQLNGECIAFGDHQIVEDSEYNPCVPPERNRKVVVQDTKRKRCSDKGYKNGNGKMR